MTEEEIPTEVLRSWKIDKVALQHRLWREDRVRFMKAIGKRLNRKKIEPDQWQVEVLKSDAKRILLNCGRQVGKSTVVSAIALHRAMFFEDTLVLAVAPSERQAKVTFAKIARFYAAAGGSISATSARKLGIEFENGSQIEALPSNADTVRGFSPDLIILDEAPYMENELYEALRPSLAATGGELIAVGTPNGRQGWFYDAWIEGEWERYRIPSVDCPRISEEFLASERKALPEYKFRQEYECSFEETRDALISAEDIDRAYVGKGWEPLGISVFGA
jgi:hypothetical protein